VNAAPASRRNTGVLLGVTSSIFFSASGTFAKALTDAGFSALQAVWLRIAGACVILILFALLRGPGRLLAVTRNRATLGGIVLFGLIAVAACQALFSSRPPGCRSASRSCWSSPARSSSCSTSG
jgi:drug/metabolite transporter (DMT)-like permease